MMSRIGLLLSCLLSIFRSYASVRLENLGLRHQVAVYKQNWLRVLGRTESSQIDQRVGHEFHAVMPTLLVFNP
jgi:hypothetical protein